MPRLRGASSAYAGAELLDLRSRGRLGAQRLGEVEAPAKRFTARPVVIHGTKIDADQIVIFIANESLAKSIFQRRARAGQAGDGIIDDRPDIFGAEPKILFRIGFVIAADLDDRPAIGAEVRVAAGDGDDIDRLAGSEIEHPGIGGIDPRIT